MTDVFTPAKRSEIMSLVKSKDTSPERRLRSALHGLGFRFRVCNNVLPGSPDIVLSRYRAIVFVHGCFWHSHECRKAKAPKDNSVYWSEKLEKNRKRDRDNIDALLSLKWRVAIVWECSLKKRHLHKTVSVVSEWINSSEELFLDVGEDSVGFLIASHVCECRTSDT